MPTIRQLRALMQRVHRNERGAVSIETVMIIGAIAIPILIWVLHYGWPRIQEYFSDGMENLETESDRAQENS